MNFIVDKKMPEIMVNNLKKYGKVYQISMAKSIVQTNIVKGVVGQFQHYYLM